MDMKVKLILLVLIALFYSCSSDDNNNDDSGNGNNNTFEITFQNSSFSGSVLVTYTDGTSQTGQFENGKCNLPKTESGNKTIASLQPQNQNIILIGRKEGTPINLNYNNGTLLHRVAVGGFVPIGSYAEFQLINSNSTTLSNSYKMETDLDFMNLNWTPIGNTDVFLGNFNGANFKIENLKVTETHASALFNMVSNSTISNITVKTGTIKTTAVQYGAAAGLVVSASTNVIIDNCVNYASIESNGRVAGIVVAGANVTNCINYGNLKTNGSGIGGVALFASILNNCHNYGELISNNNIGDSSGGVVGECFEISNSSNFGNIVSTGNGTGNPYYVGGVAGKVNTTIKGCFNRANITSSGIAGGIIGSNQIDIISIENCYNIGNITTTSYAGGGIAGILLAYQQITNLKNCYNTGGITSNSQTGGLVGRIVQVNQNNLSITNNYWRDLTSDNANYAIGYLETANSGVVGIPSNIGCSIFSTISWPSASQGWNIGNGTNNAYWKTLGSWNNGNPTYPKLWFEE